MSSAKAGGSSGSGGRNDSDSLLVIILDVSPLAWGERDLKRNAQDKARAAAGKRSVGPAVLEEVLEAVQAFSSAFVTTERYAGLIILPVADNESAVVYPRKNHMADWTAASAETTYRPDSRRIKHDLCMGVAELVTRASQKEQVDPAGRQAAMAGAFSMALALIHRFMVAAKLGGGFSALSNEHYLNRTEDAGVVALIGGGKNSKKKNRSSQAAWSPRILLIQASDDRSRDYNAFMNCAFAAVKHEIVVDACYLPASPKSSSPFLEQAVDLTGGVFLAPTGAAQVGGALTEVMMSVFLAPLHCRVALNLPALNKVDFRARCFDEASGFVDQAFVCNQCLSIFSKKPKAGGQCPTCQARIVEPAKTQQQSSRN